MQAQFVEIALVVIVILAHGACQIIIILASTSTAAAIPGPGFLEQLLVIWEVGWVSLSKN